MSWGIFSSCIKELRLSSPTLAALPACWSGAGKETEAWWGKGINPRSDWKLNVGFRRRCLLLDYVEDFNFKEIQLFCTWKCNSMVLGKVLHQGKPRLWLRPEKSHIKVLLNFVSPHIYTWLNRLRVRNKKIKNKKNLGKKQKTPAENIKINRLKSSIAGTNRSLQGLTIWIVSWIVVFAFL